MISSSKRGSPSKIAIRGWAEFIRVEQALLDRVEEDLKAASFPPLVWYDVLLELVKEPSGRLRHRDLHRRMLLAKYNLSRLLDRLEAEGLVSREPIEEDARGEYLCLTRRGRELQRRMWPVYRKAIAMHFAHRLSATDIDDLLRVLRKLG